MTGEPALHYIGDELQAFARATNWKRYLAGQIRPFLGREVLEVGAGLGETALALCSPAQARWVLLEPDPDLAASARTRLAGAGLSAQWQVRAGTTMSLGPDEQFDSIIYVDVLEHIERDAAELAQSMRHVRPGGHLVVLAPAHQWLFTAFDARIGHFRRYTRRSLTSAGPPGATLVRVRYLDAAGMGASLSNRVLLRQAMPTLKQLWLWDKCLVPVSRILDPLLAYRAGKSILAVWQRR
ncbi:MAG TPA: class I SAM-dependent methyltransferase [Vicinamibacterales bacterium]|nr:class I SAM-dependent methyltransferase [Vicinamibacterales bacterium]